MGSVLIGHWLLDSRYEYATFVDKNCQQIVNVKAVRKIAFIKSNVYMQLHFKKMLNEKIYFCLACNWSIKI